MKNAQHVSTLRLSLLLFVLVLLVRCSFGAQYSIGIGAAANDGTGETLRTAGGKINTNFLQAFSLVSLTNTFIVSGYTNTAQTLFTNAGVTGTTTMSSNWWVAGRTFRYFAAGVYSTTTVGTNFVGCHIGSEFPVAGYVTLRNTGGLIYPWTLDALITVWTNGVGGNNRGVGTFTINTNASMAERWHLLSNNGINTTTNNPLDIKMTITSSGGADTSFNVFNLGVKIEY